MKCGGANTACVKLPLPLPTTRQTVIPTKVGTHNPYDLVALFAISLERLWRAMGPGLRRDDGLKFDGTNQFDSFTTRPFVGCTGLALNGYNRENNAICAGDACITCFMTMYSTPSVHGGSLSDPMNV